MNFLPEMQHIEVIVTSGIIAVTVWTVVSSVVGAAVYFATREVAPVPKTVTEPAPARATAPNPEPRSSFAAV